MRGYQEVTIKISSYLKNLCLPRAPGSKYIALFAHAYNNRLSLPSAISDVIDEAIFDLRQHNYLPRRQVSQVIFRGIEDFPSILQKKLLYCKFILVLYE